MPEKRILSFFLPLLSALLISGCTGEKSRVGKERISPRDSPTLPSRGFFMGILPTPAKEQSFEEAYLQASQCAEFSPVWGRPTPFYDLADELSGEWGETFVEGYIRGNGIFPLIQMSFFREDVVLVTPPGMENSTLSSKDWRDIYMESALDVLRAVEPLYLSLGNEVNRWYEKYGAEEGDPNGFQHFVSLYEEIYDSIKEISSETKVFLTFSREIVGENRKADLEVLSMFDPGRLDVLVFTSYPYSVQGINNPEDIPDDYYQEAFQYISLLPMGFSELGWPSIEAFGGEEGQANFILEVSGRLTRAQGLDLNLFGWAWLHDLDENDAIGLIRRDGTEKLSFDVWKSLYSSGSIQQERGRLEFSNMSIITSLTLGKGWSYSKGTCRALNSKGREIFYGGGSFSRCYNSGEWYCRSQSSP